MVRGSALIEQVNLKLGLNLEAEGVDTLSGLLVARIGRMLEKSDLVELDGAEAEVVEVENDRATRVRITMADAAGHSQAERVD